MLTDTTFLNKLKDFGLNTYESKLWVALLSRGKSTAGELSDIANVPRSRSYDVLESLEKKGFVKVKLGKPIKYLAIPPSEVLEHLKNRVNTEMTDTVKNIEEMKNTGLFTELQNLGSQGSELMEPSDMNGVLKGRESIHNHFSYLLKKAKISIQISTSKEKLKEIKKRFGDSVWLPAKNGVSIAAVIPESDKGSQIVEEFSKFAQVRFTDRELPKFTIVDGREILMTLFAENDVHSFYDTGVWVTTEFFADTMKSLFQSTWKKAT